MLDGEQMVQSISIRGYRPTALREARRICSAPGLFESWVTSVTAWRLRRIRDDQVLDHTEIPERNPSQRKGTEAMSFTCPDCDADLESSVREIELEKGETAQILESGVLLVTKVACSNGCSSDPDNEAAKPPKKRKKTAPAAAVDGELCPKTDDCDRPAGHTGRCNHKGKPEA